MVAHRVPTCSSIQSIGGRVFANLVPSSSKEQYQAPMPNQTNFNRPYINVTIISSITPNALEFGGLKSRTASLYAKMELDDRWNIRHLRIRLATLLLSMDIYM